MNNKRTLLGIFFVFLCGNAPLILGMEQNNQAMKPSAFFDMFKEQDKGDRASVSLAMEYYSEHYYPSDETNKLEALCGCKDGSDKEALLLIEQGADPYYRDMMGISLLHRAAACGNLDVLCVLDCEDADITCRDLCGRTPLLCASSQGHLKIIDYINKRCGLLFAADNHKNGPLHYAAAHSTPETISFLLKSSHWRLDIDQKNSVGDTPLIAACSQRKWDNAKYLVENGADVNVCGDDKFTPLNYVLQGGDIDFMKLLLKKDAKVDTKDSLGNGLLHCAISASPEMLQCLIEAGAPINDKNGLEWTPLFHACRSKKPKSAKILIKKGADVNETSLRSHKPLGCPMQIDRGPEPIHFPELHYGSELETELGATPLHVLSYNGESKLIKLLLANGADIHAKTENGSTPLHVAASNGKTDVIKILLENGAKIDAETKYTRTWFIDSDPEFVYKVTPLFCAIMSGNKKAVKALATPETVRHVVGPCCATPLHYACEVGQSLDIVKILVKNNVDTKALLWGKFSAFDIVDYYIKQGISGKKDIRKFLVELSREERNAAKKLAVQNNVIQPNSTIKNAEKALFLKVDDKKKSEITFQIKEPKGLIMSCLKPIIMPKKKFVFIDDRNERMCKGGHDITFSIFKSDLNGLKPGAYWKPLILTNSPKPVINKKVDNIGSLLAINHLSKLVYSKHVQEKMDKIKDDGHSFPICIDQECGQFGCVMIKDSRLDKYQKNQLKEQFNILENIDDYWYELEVKIPAQIQRSQLSEEKIEQKGSSYEIEYVIFKKSLSDEHGLCVHRFCKKI